MGFPGSWRGELEVGEAGELAGHSWVRRAVSDSAPGVCGGAEYEGGTENRAG